MTPAELEALHRRADQLEAITARLEVLVTPACIALAIIAAHLLFGHALPALGEL